MKSLLSRLISIINPAPALQSFDEDFEARWREKVNGIRESRVFVSSTSDQLPQEFSGYLDNLLMSGECPRDISSLIKIVEGKFTSSTTAFLHDCITKEEYDLIQNISPDLLARLRIIENGPNTSLKEDDLAATQLKRQPHSHSRSSD